MVDGMDGGIICVPTWKYASKSESKWSHISISIDSWEYTGNESSVWKEERMRCSQSSRRLWVLMPRTKEDMLKHMRSSKVSGMTQIRLDLAMQAFWNHWVAHHQWERYAQSVKDLAHRSQNLR